MIEIEKAPQTLKTSYVPPPLPPYEVYTSVTHPSANSTETPFIRTLKNSEVSVINCKMSTIDHSYGANTANPVIPKFFNINCNMGTVLLHFVSFPVAMDIGMEIDASFSTVSIYVPSGVEVINEVEINMTSVIDKRSNAKFDGEHSKIKLTGKAKFANVIILNE
ncbi:hypothetical protein HK098_000226 [Nowakowskiella sp. JEL0407]|nr:hypothetical protein HK098_000226 [Nowakowskiella sp. JEL0407]